MCLPDFEPVFQMLIHGVQDMGRMVDNWMDITLLIVQNVFSPGTVPRCDAVPISTLDVNSDLHKLLFGPNNTVVVGLTETMFAATDGYSTIYYSTAKKVVQGEVAPASWPIPVDVRMGIAAVTYGDSGEQADDLGGGTTTSMMGCRYPFFIHFWGGVGGWEERSENLEPGCRTHGMRCVPPVRKGRLLLVKRKAEIKKSRTQIWVRGVGGEGGDCCTSFTRTTRTQGSNSLLGWVRVWARRETHGYECGQGQKSVGTGPFSQKTTNRAACAISYPRQREKWSLGYGFPEAPLEKRGYGLGRSNWSPARR